MSKSNNYENASNIGRIVGLSAEEVNAVLYKMGLHTPTGVYACRWEPTAAAEGQHIWASNAQGARWIRWSPQTVEAIKAHLVGNKPAPTATPATSGNDNEIARLRREVKRLREAIKAYQASDERLRERLNNNEKAVWARLKQLADAVGLPHPTTDIFVGDNRFADLPSLASARTDLP